MKKFKIILIALVMSLFLITDTSINIVTADGDSTVNTVIYFYEPTCLDCQELIGNGMYVGFYDQDIHDGSYYTDDDKAPNYSEEDDVIKDIKAAGITIIYVDLTNPNKIDYMPSNTIVDTDDLPIASDILYAYKQAYGDDSDYASATMFVGGKMYHGNGIREAFDDNAPGNEFMEEAAKGLKEVNVVAGLNYRNITGFLGFLGVLGAGFLDGFNPCAIALLLMFISLLGFTENKRVLIAVSVTYILTMFTTYFLIGLGIMSALEAFAQSARLVLIVNWAIFILVLILFAFNLYDYFVSKNEDYGKVKNQLPKWVKRMNKRIMKTFTGAMDEQGQKGNLTGVILLTFFLGVTLSFTEFVCTGQIYLGILDGVRQFQTVYGYVALLSYNVMFVLPMIVIAVIAIKSESIVGVSNWMRENLHLIKLGNTLLFLGIAIYYAFRIFG